MSYVIEPTVDEVIEAYGEMLLEASIDLHRGRKPNLHPPHVFACAACDRRFPVRLALVRHIEWEHAYDR